MTTYLPFEEVFVDETGGNIKTLRSDYLVDGQIAVVDQGKELVSGYINDEERVCRSELPAIIFGDHTRCFKFVDFPFALGADGVKVLRPKIKADEKYLYYYLRNLDIPNAGYDRHFKYLKRSKILVPALDEQKRIAEVLEKADALRQKRRLALQKLDSLFQSVFIDMFGDPVTNPKGWNVENLGDVSRLVSGNSLPEGEEFIEQKDGLFLLKVSDMNSKGNEELITVANLWAAGYGNANVICPKDSIIIPKRGGAIFTNKKRMLTRPAVLDPNLMAIIPDERIIDPQFLFQWFKGFDLGSLTSGSSVPQLNKQDLYPLRIAIPPFEKQEEFRKVASIIKVAEQKQKASNVHLDQLFNSLQQRAFSGHIFT